METLSAHQPDMFARLLDAGQFTGLLAWIYGSGFPKSHDVSKAIDKAAGAVREVVGERRAGIKPNGGLCEGGLDEAEKMLPVNTPATPEAREWQGRGTALKQIGSTSCRESWLQTR